VEDWGLGPREAAAAGRPTIALAAGGALETMVGLGASDAPPTAVFFHEQSVDSLERAILTFEASAEQFDPKALRARAEAFDRPLFKQRLAASIRHRWPEHREGRLC